MIKNKEALLSHGHREAREKALDIVTHALKACDPLKATSVLSTSTAAGCHWGIRSSISTASNASLSSGPARPPICRPWPWRRFSGIALPAAWWW